VSLPSLPRGVISLLMAMLLARQAVAYPAATRIVSLAPHLTELTYVAGAGDKLVGTVLYSDQPDAARALPRIGDAFQVDLERVLALRPDLILAWESGTRETLIQRLLELGFNVVTIPTFDIEDVGRAIRSIGRLAGTVTTAEGQALAFEESVARQRAAYSNRPPVSVFLEIDDRPLYTVNGRHLISQVVTLCGGRNIFADLPQVAPTIGLEAVIAANPDVILSTDDTDEQATAMWTSWPELRAVSSGNVYSLHADDIARPTTRLVNGIRQVCEVLETARARQRQRP
jgi:iron complex transport system substrate-binding protein